MQCKFSVSRYAGPNVIEHELSSFSSGDIALGHPVYMGMKLNLLTRGIEDFPRFLNSHYFY